MNEFFKSTKFKVLLCILVVLLAFMLRAAWTGGLSPLLSQVAGAVITPIQSVAASVSNAVGGFVSNIINAEQAARENEQLHAELNELRGQLVDFEQYKQENEMLKQFLGIKEAHPDFVLEPASVVARDVHDRFYSFTIDKGTLAGVSLQDPVISADGLVGRVVEVGAGYAKVLTILDVSVDVGAYDIRTRDIGIVAGDVTLASQGLCKLSYLPRESGAAPGDYVVTAGGSIYPKDLIIGKISRVGDDAGGISLYAEIEPAADIRYLTDVMVIKAFDGQEAFENEE